jgi:hypothetical protein
MACMKSSICVHDRLRCSEALGLADNSHRNRSIVIHRLPQHRRGVRSFAGLSSLAHTSTAGLPRSETERQGKLDLSGAINCGTAAGGARAEPHLLIALGTVAAETGYRVRYALASKLVNELVEAADDKQQSKTIRVSRRHGAEALPDPDWAGLLAGAA